MACIQSCFNKLELELELFWAYPSFHKFFLTWQSSPHPLGTEEETIFVGVVTSIPESFSCFNTFTTFTFL